MGMRIVHVADHYYPALGYQIHYLVHLMKGMGHEVSIVTSERHAPLIYRAGTIDRMMGDRLLEPGVYDEDGVAIHRLPVMAEVGSTVLLKGLEGTVASLRPDVLYVHGINTLPGVMCAMMKTHLNGTKLVYQNYQIRGACMSKLGILYPPFRCLASPMIVQRADLFIAIAEEAKDFAVEELGIPEGMVKVYAHGADPERFAMDPGYRREFREEHGIPEDSFVYLYTGKIMPFKGVHLLAEAGLRLLDKGKDVYIVAVGPGDQEYIDSIRETYRKAGREERLRIFDPAPHDRLNRFYCAADAAVWPLTTTIGHLEAMACSLPIIVSDEPASQERVRYDNGMVLHNGDLDELESYMVMLYDDRDEGARLGKNGREIVVRSLNWNEIIGGIVKELEAL
jgi:glycosyltransferase involved in cell wall biosynthesis